jgi:hypothetical protein
VALKDNILLDQAYLLSSIVWKLSEDSYIDESTITLNTSKLANEKGFRIPCKCCYFNANGMGEFLGFKRDAKPSGYDVDWNDMKYYGLLDQNGWSYILAPSQSVLQKWLRDKHGLHIRLDHNAYGEYLYDLSTNNMDVITEDSEYFKTYELALESALQAALNLI